MMRMVSNETEMAKIDLREKLIKELTDLAIEYVRDYTYDELIAMTSSISEGLDKLTGNARDIAELFWDDVLRISREQKRKATA